MWNRTVTDIFKEPTPVGSDWSFFSISFRRWRRFGYGRFIAESSQFTKEEFSLILPENCSVCVCTDDSAGRH